MSTQAETQDPDPSKPGKDVPSKEEAEIIRFPPEEEAVSRPQTLLRDILLTANRHFSQSPTPKKQKQTSYSPHPPTGMQ